MTALVKFLESQDARVDVLCFDGCMAHGLNHLTQEERRALLDAAEVFVANQDCVPVKLAEKSLNPEQWPLDYAEDEFDSIIPELHRDALGHGYEQFDLP